MIANVGTNYKWNRRPRSLRIIKPLSRFLSFCQGVNLQSSLASLPFEEIRESDQVSNLVYCDNNVITYPIHLNILHNYIDTQFDEVIVNQFDKTNLTQLDEIV